MKKEEIREIREKTLSELKKEINKRLKELFGLRMDKKMNKLKNKRVIYHKRKEIAMIKTIIREKELLNEST